MEQAEDVLEDDAAHQEVRASFPSFISLVDKKGSIDFRLDEYQDLSPLYEQPEGKSSSTLATGETTRRKSSFKATRSYGRRHAASSVIGTSRDWLSPRYDPSGTSRSVPTHRSLLSDRFLRLQQDLRRAGFATDTLRKSVSDADFELSSFYEKESLSRCNSPRVAAIRIENETGEDVSRPQLRYCANCRCEVVTETQFTASRKTW